MSILGSFFRKPPAAPAPDLAELAQRLAGVQRRLDNLDQIAVLDFNLSVAREIRELLADPRYAERGRLERHGRKVWSQNDEDGILEEIFRRIGTAGSGQPGTFVEFGVSHGRECNTLKLLVEGWTGLWMESDAECCARIERVFAAQLADGRLELKQASVTAENINALIAGARVAAAGELDLLSIDIDGNDYHVMKAVQLRPRVLVIEYNGKYPPPMDLVPDYQPAHLWDGSDYAGASLQAIANLAKRLGYNLVGTNLTGANAFFVRSELAGDHFADGDTAALFNPARYWLTAGYAAGHPPGGRFSYTSDAALAQALKSK
jgi:hypothetical protein